MRNSNSRLTAIQVAKLNRPGRYGDGGGLYLQVSQWKTKSWLFRFQRDGQERQMGLGPVGLVSLADARERALAARRLLLDGHDPIQARRIDRAKRRLADAKTVTFEYCARTYIADHRAGWRNQKHADQFTSTLEMYAFPLMRHLPVSAIDTNLVLQALQPISDRAQAILASLGTEHDPDSFVFPGRSNGAPQSNMTMLKLLRDMRPGYVVHGFRSTFKDWAAETTPHENIVTEMALAHVVGDDVERAYRRGDLMQKRRKLMQDWADYCADQVGAKGNVTTFRRKRRIL